MVTSGTTHVPPGEGTAYWAGNTEYVTLKMRGTETGEAYALVELVALPGAEPPPHIHHRMDELYCLLEGELAVLDGERVFTAKAGSIFHIPRGRLHAWRNATTKPARALVFFFPAGFERGIEEVGVPATDLSSPPPLPPPTPEDRQRLLELGRKYDTEYPSVPAW